MIAMIATSSIKVTVTPWCADSWRVRVADESASAPALRTSALVDTCKPGADSQLTKGAPGADNGNLRVSWDADGSIAFRRKDNGALLFSGAVSFAPSALADGFSAVNFTTTAGNPAELIFGLGQGNWSAAGGAKGGCASGQGGAPGYDHRVPLERNGQTVNLLQRKFHVSIPFAYSTAGYGFLFNMPGYGRVSVGAKGSGGMAWQADAAPLLDLWVSTLPAATATAATGADDGAVAVQSPAPIYKNYADATGHAPLLREDALLFWQSRLRYLNSTIALDVAQRYRDLELPVGILVVDYYNMVTDGDFQPDPRCYPSLKALSSGVHAALNASTVFSIWPEAKADSAEYAVLKAAGCLANADLGGLAMDPTSAPCRELMWRQFIKPRYFDHGVSAFWLDESDGEGTGDGDGSHGYDTSNGPAAVASNLWVNDWLRTWTEPVGAAGVAPLVLTRGVWAGGQRHGIVLWSSDVESSFEELHAQVNLGVHASLSGIPWWTSDVGGFGCDFVQPNNSTYMRELIVRWYQFGLFCPVFRTHGCRAGPSPEPAAAGDVCLHGQRSCGGNEVWSYGEETQALLSHYVKVRATMKPYLAALAANVTSHGVPTMRPLWYEFPTDAGSYGIDDQYLLGPDLLVAPISVRGATSRQVYFPAGASWRSFWSADAAPVPGGSTRMVAAPLDTIPVYQRVPAID